MENQQNQSEEVSPKIHKLEERQYNNIRIWRQKQNILSDGIMPKINGHKREVKDELNKLMGEDNEESNKTNLNSIKKKYKLNTSTSAKNYEQISPYAKKILKKINKHIKKIRDSSEDITAMNALYLDNKIFPVNKKSHRNNHGHFYNNALSKSEHIINYNNGSSNNIMSNSLDNLTNDTNNYNAAEIKKDRRNNFSYINSNYRKQLNKAFNKFNPLMYLNNLKILLQVSPSIREDIKKTKNEVEEDIKKICDKERYSKRFKEYLSKRSKSRSVAFENYNPKIYKSNDDLKRKNKLIINTNININVNKSNNNKNNNANLILNLINNKKLTIKDENTGENVAKPMFSFLPKISREKIIGSPKDLKVGYGIFEKLKRKESQKILTVREQKVEEAKKIYKISNEIDGLIGKENIDEKVNQYMEDYRLQKYLNQFKDNEIDTSLKGKDYYREQKDKINGMLGLLYTDKIQKKTLEKEREYNRRLKRDKYDYFLKIDCELKKNLQEFDEDLRSKKIDLNINNEYEDESSNLVSRKPSSL
jgi:hypothetical protein